MSCYKNRKANCLPPDCKWVVGKGCKKSSKRSSKKSSKRSSKCIRVELSEEKESIPCYKNKKANCLPPDCGWIVGKGCKKSNYVSPVRIKFDSFIENKKPNIVSSIKKPINSESEHNFRSKLKEKTILSASQNLRPPPNSGIKNQKPPPPNSGIENQRSPPPNYSIENQNPLPPNSVRIKFDSSIENKKPDIVSFMGEPISSESKLKEKTILSVSQNLRSPSYFGIENQSP